MDTKISIIIPIYNVENYLAQCLDSIILQTYKNLEIILIDDGSTDSCAQICDSYALKEARIKVIHQKNSGLSEARNAGIEAATGEYIAFIDSDDWIAPKFCETLLQIAFQNNADIVECGFVQFEIERDINLEVKDFQTPYLIYNTEEALELLMKEIIKQMACNKLFKREIIKEVLFEKNRKHEDEFWTYKIIGKATTIIKIENILYFYRQHSQSIMGQEYSLHRLDGLDALNERVLYIEKNYPSLFQLSLRSFWFASSFHYQKLYYKSNLDKDGLNRKKVWENVKNYSQKISFTKWKAKELFWIHFFMLTPNLYAKFRNFINVGIEK